MDLLIPYVRIIGHEDPNFREFTYGDCERRGLRLKRDLRRGDRVFFHTTVNGKKLITAYYIVDRVMDVQDAMNEECITAKYKALPETDDVVLFGDPITSVALERPVHFNKALAKRLSLGIPFPRNRSETQAIGSATRAWRCLTPSDVNALMRAIRLTEKQRPSQPIDADILLSTEEVSDTIEKDIESIIAERPEVLGKGLKLKYRQYDTEVGRIDLILEGGERHILIVELKQNSIGRECIAQLRRYMSWAKRHSRGKEVRGVIVCSGVMPAFRDEFARLKGIRIYRYGWRLVVRKWHQSE